MIWNVKYYNMNKQAIEDYNPLKHYDDWIKKQKKNCATKTEFAEVFKREMMWRFWSKSEWELVIIKEEDNSIWLIPWVGCRTPDDVKINVTHDNSFDWKGFAEEHIDKQIYGNRAKIDVYDQLQWRWSELVNYIWRTRLKWERDHPKFHEE
jgi:hypothetical protein